MAKESKAKPSKARGSGRPESFTPAEVIEALRKARGIQRYAAQSLGCNRKTVANMAARHPEVREVLEEELEGLIDTAEGKLAEAVSRGELAAIFFFLKTRAKARGYVERGEITGAGGKPLHPQLDYSKLSDQDLDELTRILTIAAGDTL